MNESNTLAPTDAPDLLQIARSTGLRSHLQGVSATDARALLKAFVDALPPAPASQPVTAPEGMEPAAIYKGHRLTPAGTKEFWGMANQTLSEGAKLFTAAQVQAMLAKGLAPGWQAVPVEQLRQLLADAHTAAGLVSHGKQCKALGVRLSDAVMATYAELAASPQPAAPSGPAREPLTDEQILECIPDDDEPVGLGEAFTNFARAIESAHGITAAQKGGRHGS